MRGMIENLVYSAILEWEYDRGSHIDPDYTAHFAKEFSKKWKENQDKLG